jgi:hypothetical protein
MNMIIIGYILAIVLVLIMVLFFIVLWFNEDEETKEYSHQSERQKRNDDYDNNSYL